MAYLYEAWLSAGQDWNNSRLIMQAGTKSGTVKRGRKCWMTQKQISDKFGDEVAQAIVEYKVKDPELSKSEVRWNPNCPFSEARLKRLLVAFVWQAARQYYVLDEDAEEDTEEDWVTKLFEATESDGEDEPPPTKKPRQSAKGAPKPVVKQEPPPSDDEGTRSRKREKEDAPVEEPKPKGRKTTNKKDLTCPHAIIRDRVGQSPKG